MSLKNYSTKIDVNRTIFEIERILSGHKATDIWKQYDEKGNVIALSFVVQTEFGKMPFRLPANVAAVRQVLINEKKTRRIKKVALTEEHAREVAWRILKDWIDAQMALVDISMVKLEQVFLPYAYDPVKDRTLFEAIREKRYAGLLMEAQS